MSATSQRDRVAKLATTDPDKALNVARGINDPWFRAQALSHVARYVPIDAIRIATEAEQAALKCDDHFKRSAVRAWEIAALAERGMTKDALRSLHSALAEAALASPSSSRCESLLLLMHAAARISLSHSIPIADEIRKTAAGDANWRCIRSLVEAVAILCYLDASAAMRFVESLPESSSKSKCRSKLNTGGVEPRPFFW